MIHKTEIKITKKKMFKKEEILKVVNKIQIPFKAQQLTKFVMRIQILD